MRSDSAAERSPDEVDAEIEELVERSLRAGARVVIHIVAHSKTGVHAPRLSTMNRLIAKHGDRIVPIIDAAQGGQPPRPARLRLAGLHGDPDRIQVLWRPAVLGVPAPARAVPAARSGHNPFPPGFSDYLTPAQLPADWTAARRSLEQTSNGGLLIRWMAAMEEMRAYYETPSGARYRVLRFFEAEAPVILGRSRLLQLSTSGSDPLRRGRAAPRIEDDGVQLPRERADGRAARPGHTEAMGPLDESGHLLARPGGCSGVAPRRREHLFQLGQAVHVGEQQSGEHDHVIRVAIGGTLITDVAEDTALGASLDARLGWLERKLEQLRTKIEFIAKHEPAMSRL